MHIKLFDSELKIMEVLWNRGDLTAGIIAKILKDEIGWNRNTTYTIIKKCIEKGAIERLEPNFTCHALITKEEIQELETMGLISKLFNGSTEMFFSSFFNSKNLTKEEIDKLKQIVDDLS
ncbi:BlaI/MecI/CopY family transcriptional regulator [Paenibacillus peoriae]|uniref:BlaI/MecI/CopY family transcriptional regulator n=1 Tax=Paenibacillus peoriae TaxID=59893 RepID=UPI00026C647D|nr:BlaI/MecI/CopY family transcriptional regulator [Paenibacillus peoriae]MEC0182611.1 BlaI/MecI/CopY family transcriptional regulator [Paenibacillus peoriae]